MKPLSDLTLLKPKAVFTDLDDTLTDHGLLTAETYRSLFLLKEKGIKLVIVSGRPAGWADCLIRLLPLDALVFENGAGVLVRTKDRPEVVMFADSKTLADQKKKLRTVFEQIQKDVPAAKLALDQRYRLFDFAIDFAEDPPRLSKSDLEKVLKILEKASGVTHKLSSIHVNFWCGDYSKTTACEFLLKRFNLALEEVIYCGDSPNDEPLFKHFPHSIGVANVLEFKDRMESLPRFVTKNRGGSGFQELVAALVN